MPPSSIGKGIFFTMFLFCPTHWYFFYIYFLIFYLNLGVAMTNAVSNGIFFYLKAVLLWWEHMHFSHIFALHDTICPPPFPPSQ